MSEPQTNSVSDVFEGLVDLARTQSEQPIDQERFDHGCERWLHTLATLPHARSSRRRTGFLLACAAVLLLVVGGILFRPRTGTLAVSTAVTRPLRWTVEGTVTHDGYAEVPVNGHTAFMRFEDGTAVDLTPGTAVRVVSTTADGAQINLEFGAIHCAVVHRERARWAVHAGPFAIVVHGTDFEATWSPATGDFHVVLNQGSVTVTGPSSTEGLVLHASQELTGHMRDGSMQIAPSAQIAQSDMAVQPVESSSEVDAARVEPFVAATVLDAATVLSVVRTPAHRTPMPSRVPSEHRLTWAQSMADGDGETVLRDARAQGIENVLLTHDVDSLVALGDAARYAREKPLALQVMLAVRSRFPQTTQARDAAFFLGQLIESSDPRTALDWYLRYLDEQPAGAMVPEALARALLAADVANDSRADGLAARYLDRFPDGPVAHVARRRMRDA